MIFVQNNKHKYGEALTTALLFSVGLVVFGTVMGSSFNRNREIINTQAQSTCTYNGVAQVLQEDGSPLIDSGLRILSRFTDNNGKPHESLEAFDGAGRNEKINYAFDKQKYDNVRVTLNLKKYDDRYEIIDTWCTENGQECGSIGTEQVKAYIRCGSNVVYGWKLKRKAGTTAPPVATPRANSPTTPPQQAPQICSAVNASCYEEYVEACATGTRTCYKTGVCSGPGNGTMCEWGGNSCCSACSDPAGNDNNTCGNRQPPNTPILQPTQRQSTTAPQPTSGVQPTQSAQTGRITGRISISTGTLPANRWLKLNRCDSTGCYSPTYLQNNETFTFNGAPYGNNTLSISKWVYDLDGINKEYYDTLRINNCEGGQSEGNTFCAVNVNSAQMGRNLTIELPEGTPTPQPTTTTVNNGSISVTFSANFNPGAVETLTLYIRKNGETDTARRISNPITRQLYTYTFTGLTPTQDYDIWVNADNSNGEAVGTRYVESCTGTKPQGDFGQYCKLKPINNAQATFTVESSNTPLPGKVSGVINIRNQSGVIYQIGAMAISICQETTCLRYDQSNAGTFTIKDSPDSRTMNFNYSFNYFPSNPTRRLEVGDNNLSIKLSVNGTTWTNAQPLNQITTDLKQNINYIIPAVSGTITADITGDNQVDSLDFFAAQQAFGKEITINGKQQQVSALFISYIIANMGRGLR